MVGGGGGGAPGKIFGTLLLLSNSLEFDMHYEHVLKKLNFDLVTPSVREVSAGKIFATT